MPFYNSLKYKVNMSMTSVNPQWIWPEWHQPSPRQIHDTEISHPTRRMIIPKSWYVFGLTSFAKMQNPETSGLDKWKDLRTSVVCNKCFSEVKNSDESFRSGTSLTYSNEGTSSRKYYRIEKHWLISTLSYHLFLPTPQCRPKTSRVEHSSSTTPKWKSMIKTF